MRLSHVLYYLTTRVGQSPLKLLAKPKSSLYPLTRCFDLSDINLLNTAVGKSRSVELRGLASLSKVESETACQFAHVNLFV